MPAGKERTLKGHLGCIGVLIGSATYAALNRESKEDDMGGDDWDENITENKRYRSEWMELPEEL